jgi:lipopolysaccharide transport system ATP-binding protein
MSNVVIQVDRLSKQYRLGAIGGKRLVDDVNRWWARFRGKEDPLSKIGSGRRKTPSSNSNLRSPTSETLWALKDVSFEVKQGEVLGIIGRNGAGKSTLLKILSRVTGPTTGEVRVKGRIASLLEVGTGFHPELTGRENIFLNGAILGMTKEEIRKRFDEIVAFSEVEQFIDTPVKRYSSGMHVRLAFAVAAHLEPEILIVDEVLAVGDFEFQKKCLGKMGDVAREGRTVLFVSHTMAAVKSLTTRALLLANGSIACDTNTNEAISKYLETTAGNPKETCVEKSKGAHAAITNVKLLDAGGKATDLYTPGTIFDLEIYFTTDGSQRMSIELFLTDANQTRVALASLHHFDGISLPVVPGDYVCKLRLQPMWLASGSYGVDAATSFVRVAWDHQVEKILTFNVPFSNPNGLAWDFKHADGHGIFAWVADKKPEIVLLHQGESSKAKLAYAESGTKSPT